MDRRAIITFFLLFFGFTSQAVPFKCDLDQKNCEANAKRWTIGDKVGAFSSENTVIATGVITEIRDQIRVIRIEKRWGTLYRDHDMRLITDAEFLNPGKFFKLPIPTYDWSTSIYAGLINLEVGRVMTGMEWDILLHRRVWKGGSLLFKAHLIHAKGEASEVFLIDDIMNVAITSSGVSFGLTQDVMQSSQFSAKLSADLGVSKAAIQIDKPIDPVEVLDGRVNAAYGLYASVGGVVSYLRNGLRPELGFNFVRLHDSINPFLFVGFNLGIK